MRGFDTQKCGKARGGRKACAGVFTRTLEPGEFFSFCHAHYSSATCGAANTCSRLGRAGIKCGVLFKHRAQPSTFTTFFCRQLSDNHVSSHPPPARPSLLQVFAAPRVALP